MTRCSKSLGNKACLIRRSPTSGEGGIRTTRSLADRRQSVCVKNAPKIGGISLTTARRLEPSDWRAASNESS